LQEQRGPEKFPVIPLSLDGTKLGVLESLFTTEPYHILVSSAAGGAEAAVAPIFVALGRRKSPDVASSPQPAANPLEHLVLELTDLKLDEKDGKRRASARARLVYEPATPGQRQVHTEQFWQFVSPIGPIEAEELRRGKPRALGPPPPHRWLAERPHSQCHESLEHGRRPLRPSGLRMVFLERLSTETISGRTWM
jgi:hypothetical protein